MSVPGRVLALAGLAGTAGVIHIVAAVEHVTDDQILGGFFACVGAAQLFAGWSIYRRPENLRLLTAVAVSSTAVALLWVLSRTTGLPFGTERGQGLRCRRG